MDSDEPKLVHVFSEGKAIALSAWGDKTCIANVLDDDNEHEALTIPAPLSHTVCTFTGLMDGTLTITKENSKVAIWHNSLRLPQGYTANLEHGDIIIFDSLVNAYVVDIPEDEEDVGLSNHDDDEGDQQLKNLRKFNEVVSNIINEGDFGVKLHDPNGNVVPDYGVLAKCDQACAYHSLFHIHETIHWFRWIGIGLRDPYSVLTSVEKKKVVINTHYSIVTESLHDSDRDLTLRFLESNQNYTITKRSSGVDIYGLGSIVLKALSKIRDASSSSGLKGDTACEMLASGIMECQHTPEQVAEILLRSFIVPALFPYDVSAQDRSVPNEEKLDEILGEDNASSNRYGELVTNLTKALSGSWSGNVCTQTATIQNSIQILMTVLILQFYENHAQVYTQRDMKEAAQPSCTDMLHDCLERCSTLLKTFDSMIKWSTFYVEG